MLDVVCWKWKAPPGYRSIFLSQHVNTLAAMVRRHYPNEHRFSCITDDADGIDTSRVRVIPLWDDLRNIQNPSFKNGPHCYARLKAFSKEAAEVIGPRFVSLDLDCVIVGDMRPLWDRPEDYVAWGDSIFKGSYNGSMWLMSAGSRTFVWETFDPTSSPQAAHAAGFRGSDQGWVSYCLTKRGEATWTRSDGVYSFRNDHLGRLPLPANARIVLFHGHVDPWTPACKAIPWVRKNYRHDL